MISFVTAALLTVAVLYFLAGGPWPTFALGPKISSYAKRLWCNVCSLTVENGKEAQQIAENIQQDQLAALRRKIIELCKTIKINKASLRRFYNKWGTINQDAIESLTKLMNQILLANTVANTVSGGATLAEIIGGSVCIGGAISGKPDLTATGDKITKGGIFVNAGTSSLRSSFLNDLCQSASIKVKRNKKCTDALEKKRCSYFQLVEGLKTELRKPEVIDSLPLLLQSAQREGIDFLGVLGIDEDTKSKLRTNIQQMCRANAEKIKATTQVHRTQDAETFDASIPVQFKSLIDDDNSSFSIFSEETKKFLLRNVESAVPALGPAESWLEECSIESALRESLNLYGMSSAVSSASRAEVVMMTGCRIFENVNNLNKIIREIRNGSNSEESEELEETIEEIKEMRENIVEAMKRDFGWQEPCSKSASCPALTY